MPQLTECCALTWLQFSADHPALPGHFPGRPVIPGVVLLAQMQALLATHLATPFQLQSLPTVKFLQPVLPNQALQLGIELTHHNEQQMRGRFMWRSADSNALLAQGNFQLQLAAAS